MKKYRGVWKLGWAGLAILALLYSGMVIAAEAPAEKLAAVVKQLPGDMDQALIEFERQAGATGACQSRLDRRRQQ